MRLKSVKNAKYAVKVTHTKLLIIASLSILIIGIVAVFYLSGAKKDVAIQQSNQEGGYRVLQTIKRDLRNPQYTQGLVFLNDTHLIESSGLYGSSSMHFLEISDPSKLISNRKLGNEYFGEGCDLIGNKIYQLTWQERKIFVYNLELQKIDEMTLSDKITSGWGISHNNDSVLISDGTAYIYFCEWDTLQVKKKVKITHDGKDVVNLNELEFVNGLLYTNVYLSTKIVAIDLDKGQVVKEYDFSALRDQARRSDPGDCLNGIAYRDGHFWVTGKRWPFLWQIDLY